MQQTIKPLFDKLDLDTNGNLDIQELAPLISYFISCYEENHGLTFSKEQTEQMRKQIVAELDCDQSGAVDELELRVYLTRKYEALFRKH